MAKIAKGQTSTVYEMEGYEGHFEELDDYTVGFETYTAEADLAPLFRGLPDDRCQCRHWGVVLKGCLIYRHGDGTEERITAGEAYYVGPGHTPVLTAGTEVIEFSPTAELGATLEVVMRNLEGAEAGAASK